MRIAATADLHGFLPTVPECDVLVIAGDITPIVDHGVTFQARWLDGEFRAWLDTVPATHVVAVAGNHDFIFERAARTVPDDLRWTYLEDGGATIGGVRFWGSPWTPWFYDWAFNAPRFADGEGFLERRYSAAPEDTDVLVVHGPPAGYGDQTERGPAVGSQAFLGAIDRVTPALAIFGHIHEDRGTWTRNATTLANVSAVDLNYQLTDDPIRMFEL